jgi:predicted secreted protein
MKQKHYRRFLLLLILLSAATFANAQIKVEASETVELMAILSRTAGFREYCMDMGEQYTKDTEAWFAPYKQHPAAVYMKDLRSKFNMGYDAVMTMAINLETDEKTGKAFENGTDYAATLIHEFNHSFINPLYDCYHRHPLHRR